MKKTGLKFKVRCLGGVTQGIVQMQVREGWLQARNRPAACSSGKSLGAVDHDQALAMSYR